MNSIRAPLEAIENVRLKPAGAIVPNTNIKKYIIVYKFYVLNYMQINLDFQIQKNSMVTNNFLPFLQLLDDNSESINVFFEALLSLELKHLHIIVYLICLIYILFVYE